MKDTGTEIFKMYHFYAFINRMKYINRWGLMRNTDRENLKEHSFQVAVIAHALALIEKERSGRRRIPTKRRSSHFSMMLRK